MIQTLRGPARPDTDITAAFYAYPPGFLDTQAPVTVEAGKDFLPPGQGQAGGQVAAFANAGKPLLRHGLLEKIDNFCQCPAAVNKMFAGVSHKIPQSHELLGVHKLFHIAQVNIFPVQ